MRYVHWSTRSPYFVVFGKDHILSGSCHKALSLNEKNLNIELSEILPSRSAELDKVYESVAKRLKCAYDKVSRRYNLRRRPITYCVGDTVWHKNHALFDKSRYFAAKLSPKYVGPFKVRKKTGTCTYELVDDFGKSVGTWHVNNLKPVPD